METFREALRNPWVRLGLLAAGAAAAVGVTWLILSRRREATLAPDGVVESRDNRRSGSPGDRGRVRRIGIDVEGLRQTEQFEPAVEYLTYIQSRRGVSEHLLFVRNEDLEAIAALEGQQTDAFIERLQHLGVVVSNN